MPTDLAVELARRTLAVAVFLVTPLLVVATIVSLLINLAQVLTSLQDTTLATVPRLAAVAVAVFLLLPWMVRRMGAFTVALFSDFHPYLH